MSLYLQNNRIKWMFLLLVFLLAFPLIGLANADSSSQDSSKETLLVVRGNSLWPPNEMMVDGKLSGFHIEQVQIVAAKLNIEVVFASYPWKRALEMVKTGQADAITYVAKNHARAKFIHFFSGNTLSSTTHHLIKHKARKDIAFSGDVSTLSDYKIVHISGYSYGAKFDNATYLNKTPLNTIEQIIKLIQRQRYDLGIVDLADLQGSMSADQLQDIKFLQPPLYSKSVYIGFSKLRRSRQFAERFATAMDTFKASEEYLALQKKYGLYRPKKSN